MGTAQPVPGHGPSVLPAHSDSVLLRTGRPGAAGALGKQCPDPRDGFFIITLFTLV